MSNAHNVVTRFAPSPTGVLHTGSARTALYNYLFSKHNAGKFLLRIEDTDQERSKKEFEQAIINDLKWLGIEWDGEIIYQLSRIERHKQVAHEMVQKEMAYYCYSTQDEIEQFRQENPHAKFNSPWRDFTGQPPHDKPVVRLKAPKSGSTVINDLIQGRIEVENSELDDMVMLRSDGTPTYMLAVVVDDHDMGVTHVIRGDDHLTNAFRQYQIYSAMGWEIPQFAHIPLIHDREGKKLSKRAGALGIDNYIELGYLKEAVCNHLLKLGWAHGDDEIIPMNKAIEWFDLQGVGKSPAKFDIDKLNFINAHYLRELDPVIAYDLIKYRLADRSELVKDRICKGYAGLAARSHTLVELAQNCQIYISKIDPIDEKSSQLLANGALNLVQELVPNLALLEEWNEEVIKQVSEKFVENKGLKLPAIMQALRAVVVGTFAAPGVFEVMAILGKDEVMSRIAQN